MVIENMDNHYIPQTQVKLHVYIIGNGLKMFEAAKAGYIDILIAINIENIAAASRRRVSTS